MKTLETLLINRGRYWGSNKTRGEKEHISQILGQNYFKIFAAFRGWEANDPPGKKLISYGPCIHTHQIFSWEQYCFRYICLYLLLVIYEHEKVFNDNTLALVIFCRKLDIVYWVIRNKIIRFFSVRVYIYLARSWAVFNVCSSCSYRCWNLWFPFSFFLFLLLPSSLWVCLRTFLNRVCVLQFLSCNPLLY